jgi:hypothetical protein
MTKLLEQAVEAARALPPESQDDIARILCPVWFFALRRIPQGIQSLGAGHSPEGTGRDEINRA